MVNTVAQGDNCLNERMHIGHKHAVILVYSSEQCNNGRHPSDIKKTCSNKERGGWGASSELFCSKDILACHLAKL